MKLENKMGFGLIYIVPTIIVLFVVRKYRESKWAKCKNNVLLDNKVAIVTGANSGIGLEIAKELALRNAQVIVACRTIDKANDACMVIRSKTAQNLALIPMEIDLASLESIQKFANRIKNEFKQIHLLVNNAGVSFPKKNRIETVDKFEIHFGVNYLGHFHLTNLLLDSLEATNRPSPSRIVVIASSLHDRGEINLEDLNNENVMRKSNLYANSKLANIYFAQELARRVASKNIKVYACCPGWVYTGLFRNFIKWYHYIFIAPIAFFFMRSPNQGAQTPIYCLTDPNIENETGLLYRDCQHYSGRIIFYDTIAKQLWEQTEILINNALKHKTE